MDKQEQKTVRLEVRSRGDKGFRREGRLWTPDPIEDSFTEDAAQRLEQERQLIVRRLDGSKPSEAAPAGTATSSPFSQAQPSGVTTTAVDSAARNSSSPVAAGSSGPPQVKVEEAGDAQGTSRRR